MKTAREKVIKCELGSSKQATANLVLEIARRQHTNGALFIREHANGSGHLLSIGCALRRESGIRFLSSEFLCLDLKRAVTETIE